MDEKVETALLRGKNCKNMVLRYENVVGLTEVKAAQARVVECERKFIETQEMRREAQKMISDVQKRIKDIHLELEKTHRGEDRYLVLVTQIAIY